MAQISNSPSSSSGSAGNELMGLLPKILLKDDPQSLPQDLFSSVAEEAAVICCRSKDRNKSAQIRRFYDELAMWNEKVENAPVPEAKFREALPFIQMIRAKAAYARGRRLIDENFEGILGHLIKQIQSPQTLKYAKLFFEAFLGFKKSMEA